jgi:8-oxo-dGTP pyrophosphatase MutT (NUDIX family)
MIKVRMNIRETIAQIEPFDITEHEEKENTLTWIDSNVDIFRIQKPAVPPKHLICYFLPIDINHNKMLLVDHRISGRLLPPGGHVDINELPIDTVIRECQEELHETAIFLEKKPIFLSSIQTVGNITSHVDVCLWYALLMDSTAPIHYDQTEFSTIQWCDLNAKLPDRLDTHFLRFLSKLQINYLENLSRA